MFSEGITTTMNQILDRFYRLLKSYGIQQESGDYYDSDYKEAWEELDDFLSGKDSQTDVPEFLREDYRVLNVPFGAPFIEVKKRYIILVKKYHPDQYESDPVKRLRADEKIKAVNVSFSRIKAWETAKEDTAF